MRNIQYFWRHPLAEQVRAEGRAEGWAEAILRVLQLRQIDVPAPTRDRILTSTDPDELATWLDRSHEIAHATELFTAPRCPDER